MPTRKNKKIPAQIAIETITKEPLPESLVDLDDHSLEMLKNYIEQVLLREREGMDDLFESMSLMMKYIPNIILHNLVPKYVSPLVSARICRKLELKQLVSLANGLPIDFVAGSAIEMEHDLAISVLSRLKPKVLTRVSDQLLDSNKIASARLLPELVLQHGCRIPAADWSELEECLESPYLTEAQQALLASLVD